VLAVVAYGTGPVLLTPFNLSPVANGLALGALSGVAGIVAFLAAMGLRLRALDPFGVRSTTVRWVLLGLGGGVLAFVLSRIISVIMFALGIQPENIQASYTEGGSGGTWSLVLSLLFLALLTPLGEELIFRGVVTTTLLRYGAPIGVIGNAMVFALMHGLNAVFYTALIVGLITGELRRRSGSIWPGFATHVINNFLAHGLALGLALSA
jgi:membrane protease YdiL (CAAX protease family)